MRLRSTVGRLRTARVSSFPHLAQTQAVRRVSP